MSSKEFIKQINAQKRNKTYKMSNRVETLLGETNE